MYFKETVRTPCGNVTKNDAFRESVEHVHRGALVTRTTSDEFYARLYVLYYHLE